MRRHRLQRHGLGAAAAADASLPQSLPYTAEENWRNIQPPTDTEKFEGHVGRMNVYDTNGNTIRETRMARLFRTAGGTGTHCNIYSAQVLQSEERDDGLQEQRWSYSEKEHSMADGWYHPYTTRDGPLRCRALALPRYRVSSVCFTLPLQELLAQGVPHRPTFANEMFFRHAEDGRNWSGSPYYTTSTGELQGFLFIREYRINDIVPEDKFDLDPPQVKPVRGELPEDRSKWLGNGKWRGLAEELYWTDAEGGGVRRVPEHEAVWEPPPPEYKVMLLSDLFYAAGPSSLPMTADEVPPQGVWLEMGGRTSESTFRQTRVCYGPDGRFNKLRFVEFTRSE